MKNTNKKEIRPASVIAIDLHNALDKRNDAIFAPTSNEYNIVAAHISATESALASYMTEYNTALSREYVATFDNALSALLASNVPACELVTMDEDKNPIRATLADTTREISLADVRALLPDGFMVEAEAIARLAAYKVAPSRGIEGAEAWLTEDVKKGVADRINAMGGKNVKSKELSEALHKLVLKVSGGDLSLGKSAHWYVDLAHGCIKLGDTCTDRALVKTNTILRHFQSFIVAAATDKNLTAK